jgi:hypothetical protein
MKRKPAYRAPRNAAERIAEAKAAIARIEHELNTVRDAKYGDYGRSCRDSIKRWQMVIDREAGGSEGE